MPENLGKEQGMSGLVFSSTGYVMDEYHPRLAGRNALRVYREMWDNDPVVGAIIFAITMLIRQVDWTTEDNPEGTEGDADFLKECMDDMSHSWSDFISEVMSMLVFGFSYFEIVYKRRQGPQKDTMVTSGNIAGDKSTEGSPASRQADGGKVSSAQVGGIGQVQINDTPTSKYDDGKVGWRKIAFRSQESLDRWIFGTDGSVQAFVQKPAPSYQDIIIPIQKSLLFRTTTYKNNPEGRSVLRLAYRPWFYKKRIEEIEGVGIERDLAGLPFAEVDPAILSANATPDQKAMLAAITQLIKNVRQDREAGIIWPKILDEQGNSMYEFKLLNSGGSRQFDTDKIIQRYDQRIAMTVLADFILLGHENVGSFALSSDKTDLFAVGLGAWLDSIEDVLNRFAVPRLYELNGMDTTKMARIKHGDIEKPDLAEIAAYIATLTGVGMPMFPDANLEKHLRELGDLPEPSEEDAAFHDQQQLQELMQMLNSGAQQGTPPGTPMSNPVQGAPPMDPAMQDPNAAPAPGGDPNAPIQQPAA